MEVKPGYKQTEVGVIPVDWEVPTAAAVCDLVVDCKNRTPPVVEGGDYAVVRTPNVRKGKFIRDDLRFTDEQSFSQWTARAIPQVGDILITREAPLGEVCLVPSDVRVCLGQRMMLYRTDREKADSHFLMYALMSSGVQSYLLRKIGGSTVGHAKVDDIRNLLVPLPPTKPEQEAIAEALSDADALIESLAQLLAKKRQLQQGAMQELLTGKKRLPGFSGKWEEKRLGDVIETFVGGGTPSRSNQQYWGGNVPWVTVKDFATFNPRQSQETITTAGLKNSASHLIPAGTLITSTRMALGKAVVYDVDVAINQDLKALFPKPGLSPQYLRLWFQYHGPAIEELGSGSTVKGIALTDLKKIEFHLPSPSEQTAIAAILSDMDAEIAALEAKLAKARQLKQGMMQELLTGRIRLV